MVKGAPKGRPYRVVMKTRIRPRLFIILFSCLIAVTGVGSLSAQTQPPQTIRAQSGDTLLKLSQRLNVPAEELARLNGMGVNTRLKAGQRILVPAAQNSPAPEGEVVGKRITLADGYSFEADEVWKEGDQIWYRKGNISKQLEVKVNSVTPIVKAPEVVKDGGAHGGAPLQGSDGGAQVEQAIWIYLEGGARLRVEEVSETSEGAWYRRGNLSMFLERERIARIEREVPVAAGASGDWRQRGWTSGNARIDQLIRVNGARFGVDPYLIFCVIEHESQFKTRALSPKGAQGLMQLMPATARRLGVRNAFDPAENIMGGTRYLKELMGMFGGRMDLVLASYNAGEGAVMKYGRTVPPYRETRNYVKQITKRYGDEKEKEGGEGSRAGKEP